MAIASPKNWHSQQLFKRAFPISSVCNPHTHACTKTHAQLCTFKQILCIHCMHSHTLYGKHCRTNIYFLCLLRPSPYLYVCLYCCVLVFPSVSPRFWLPVGDWLPPPSPRHQCTSAHPPLSRIGCRHHTPTANALYPTNHLSVRPHLNPVLCTVQKPLTLCVFRVGVCMCLCDLLLFSVLRCFTACLFVNYRRHSASCFSLFYYYFSRTGALEQVSCPWAYTPSRS